MKKTALILAAALLLSLMAGCGAQRVSVDTSDGGDLSPASDSSLPADGGEEAAAPETTEEPQAAEEPEEPFEPEYVTLSYDGNTAETAVESIYFDEDGRLAVALMGTGYTFDNTLPIRNGQIVVPFGVDVRAGGAVYSWETVRFGTGLLTYFIPTSLVPEEVILYSNDNKTLRYTVDAAPYTRDIQPVVGNTEASPDQETTEEPEAAGEELSGRWLGEGQPLNGGVPFTVRVDFKEDGPAVCRVWQAGYTERFEVYFNEGAHTFSADFEEGNALQVAGCGGKFECSDGILSLHIEAQITSGETLTYEATLEKAEPVETVTDEPYTMVTSKFSVQGTYTGQWRDGKPNGIGTLTIQETNERWDTGDTLWSEDWVDGLIEGYGEWRSAVDGAYDGYFVTGLKEGYGRMWFNDGRVYDGRWSKGAFVG